jgi:Ser/Thr protein kinase RdoA (MazF antagonist)
MNESVVAKALAAYGVTSLAVRAPQKGYRNESFAVDTQAGQTLNIIFYKSEVGILERIHNANAVGGYLAAQNFPARCLHDPRILRLRSGRHLKYAAMYNYLPGHTIPWEGYNQDHIKLLGKTMSDMHAALKNFERDELPEVADEYLAIVARMKRYFAEAPVQRALREKLLLTVDMARFEQFEALLVGSKLLPGKQPLHMDFVRSNILFQDDSTDSEFKVRISGILDFEKTAYGLPLFDIARTLAFLLIDCKYKQPHKVRKYFLGSGYIKRGAAILPERHLELLDPLVDLFLFYDFYKFLRHNPYESLPDNEHFMRTVTALMPERLVVPTTSVAT